jgi:hypothetical protein
MATPQIEGIAASVPVADLLVHEADQSVRDKRRLL